MNASILRTALPAKWLSEGRPGLSHWALDRLKLPAGRESKMLYQRASKALACLAAVAAVTLVGSRMIAVNATTVGFAYLMLVLVIASTWGFFEAALSSVAATLTFNLCFLPPVGALTIADPQNWVALGSFLSSALIASRLSTTARRRAQDALERQQDIERLYSFSRAILMSRGDEPFPSQLVRNLAETFGFATAVLYVRRTGEFFHAGPANLEELSDQLRDAALHGTAFSNPAASRTITAICLGAEPIGSLALQGSSMPDSVLQGVSNLVAIGLERAKAQDLTQEIEVARQSEQLRTTLIDAMAHEFKTPLTLIKGVTTSVLAGGDRLAEATREQITIADEEAEHLRELLDDAIEMARLDTAQIDANLEVWDIEAVVREVVDSMRPRLDGRPVEIVAEAPLPPVALDARLVKLAFKQVLDNALKYSPPESAIAFRLSANHRTVAVEIVDHGVGIPPEDEWRVFDRFYRGQAVRAQIPGSGLGLTIARSIMQAHHGDLTFTSRPGETVFRVSLPLAQTGGPRH